MTMTNPDLASALRREIRDQFRLHLRESLGVDIPEVARHLQDLPGLLKQASLDAAAGREALRQAKEGLKEVELPLRLEAQQNGKNAEQRELLFEQAAAADSGIRQARETQVAAESELAKIEIEREEILERSRNLRALARLVAACLGEGEEH